MGLLMLQNNLNNKVTEARISAQLPLKDKAHMACHILDNLGEWILHADLEHSGVPTAEAQGPHRSHWHCQPPLLVHPLPPAFPLAGHCKAGSPRPRSPLRLKLGNKFILFPLSPLN